MPANARKPVLQNCVLLAADGFIDDLKLELGAVTELRDRLVFAPLPEVTPAWAQDIWFHPERISFDSISEAARLLKARGKFWSLYPLTNHRRAALIQEQLPKVKLPPLKFGEELTLSPIGAWALLDAHTLVLSPQRWKLWPHGEMNFIEDKNFPPTRAYLKLWEILTLIGEKPKKGD